LAEGGLVPALPRASTLEANAAIMVISKLLDSIFFRHPGKTATEKTCSPFARHAAPIFSLTH
jgi:hypothetical protein